MGKGLILIIILSVTAFGQNDNEMLIVDETGKAILRIFVTCQYKLVLKNPKDKEISIHVNQVGNGFFASHHVASHDFVVSAAHLFVCNTSIGEHAFRDILTETDRNSEEDLSIENIVALKNGKISNISAFTYAGAAASDIKIIFNTPSPKILSDPDRALLNLTVSEDVFHAHINLMEDKTFDEVFSKSVIGKEVVARGFLLYQNGWFLRYRNALVEWLKGDIFQINELLDNGLSGSPVVYFNGETMYAVGVVSHGPVHQIARNFDMSWITIIKKSFLEKRNKK